ncbi:MAG: iron ABC transporter [Gammaproteobacteria bacterium]|nr:MAG: iron ABC transporter [Gammaproteobacteria bacterium]
MLAIERASAQQEGSRQVFIPLLLLTCLIVSVLSLGIGGVSIAPSKVLSMLFSVGNESLTHAIIWEIRLPRVVLSLVVGAGLGVCGAAMQAIFRNPLADPGLIGVSSGAALGAVTVIVLGNTLFNDFANTFGIYAVPVGAFLGCLAVCAIIYRLSAHAGQFTIISLLLAGIAVSAIVGALIGFMTLISTDQQLRDMTFWSMGSLAGNHWQLIFPSLIAIIAASLAMVRLSVPLNLYLLGENQAKHLGIDVTGLKKRVFLYTAVAVGASVAITGVIGFVGFIVPHIIRLIIGPDHRYLMPASMLLGAILLTLSDLLARTIILPAEMPIGLITSAIGGPFFLLMLMKTYQKIGH